MTELIEPGRLALVKLDDDVSAACKRYALITAKGEHLLVPRHAGSGLEGPRRIVDAGVHDATVVPRLMAGERRFFLEHRHPQPRSAQQDLSRSRQAHDPPADDGEIVLAPTPVRK